MKQFHSIDAAEHPVVNLNRHQEEKVHCLVSDQLKCWSLPDIGPQLELTQTRILRISTLVRITDPYRYGSSSSSVDGKLICALTGIDPSRSVVL